MPIQASRRGIGQTNSSRDPAIIAEVKRRAHAALRQSEKPKADQREKISQLETEIENLTDAIASGLLRSSPALAQRLSKAEDELARIRAAQTIKAPMLVIPDIEKRWLQMVDSLDVMLTREPERAREELRGRLDRRIQVTPDESKRFLWADYELGFSALVPSAEIMVAGGRYEPYSNYPLHVQAVAASIIANA